MGQALACGGARYLPSLFALLGMFCACTKQAPRVGALVRTVCNELGKGRPGYWERPASETGSTDDGLLVTSKNKHNPVIVYNDLMINNSHNSSVTIT